MKLNFSNTSIFMLRTFQVTISIGLLFGLFVLLFVEDTSTQLTFGPLDLDHGNNIAQMANISITPLDTNMTSPKIVVDHARVNYYVHNYGYRVVGAILFSIAAIIGLYALQQLILMIKSLDNGNPFIRDNVWRIYILATVVYLVPVFNLAFYLFNYFWIKSNFVLDGLQLNWQTPESGQWIIFGTLLITIGKIFEQGIKLREENELTV